MIRNLVLSIIALCALALFLGTWMYAMAQGPPSSPPDPVAAALDQLQAEMTNLREAHEDLAQRVPEPETQIDEQEVEPLIERIDISGQDLVDFLNLTISKFSFHLPPEEYTAYLWIERWTRDAASPEWELLLTHSGVWSENTIVIKPPTDRDSRLFVRIADYPVYDPVADPIDPVEPTTTQFLTRQPLALNQPVHLVTTTHNRTERMAGGLRNVHRTHDHTVYIKAGFTRGSFVTFDPAKWIAGVADSQRPATQSPPAP